MLYVRMVAAFAVMAAASPSALAQRARGSAAPVAAVDVPVTIVSLSTQSIAVYAGTTAVATGRISSGKPGHRTPTGVFSVLERRRYHESNLYSNAPMPWMQRLTWSGIALHAGQLPGYPASHGCIRMSDGFATDLYRRLARGSRVLISDAPVVPIAITHPALPTPEPTMVTPAGGGYAVMAGGPRAAAPTWLAPKAAAEHARTQAATTVEIARLAARQLLDAARSVIAASAAAREDRAAAEAAVGPYQAMAERARAALTRATNDEDRLQADASLLAAEDAVAEARAVVAVRAAEERAVDAASFEAAGAARDAEDAAEEAETAQRVAQAGLQPLTVFISRKENRAYARQGFEPVFEGDVIIADASSPLGTHVFTARAGDGDGVSWTVATLSDGRAGRGSPHAALDRITLDEEFATAVRRRIWAGATIIISDQGHGIETGRYTDFIVLTR